MRENLGSGLVVIDILQSVFVVDALLIGVVREVGCRLVDVVVCRTAQAPHPVVHAFSHVDGMLGDMVIHDEVLAMTFSMEGTTLLRN